MLTFLGIDSPVKYLDVNQHNYLHMETLCEYFTHLPNPESQKITNMFVWWLCFGVYIVVQASSNRDSAKT